MLSALRDWARDSPATALYTTASVDAVIPAHPEVDWEQLRTVPKGRRSPLAALRPEPAPA
ncbi:hypothetical protein E2C11_07785 [Streptomyces lavendulae]|nr:hypothetical protein E2C11_07785 [Streptomyces lavendulae]